MKYDLTKKPSRSTQRTLQAFSTTMFELLAQKNFDLITVKELCDLSNYPRATFYNYFDDKYDLTNYCWYLLLQEVNFDDLFTNPKEPSEDKLIRFFDRVYYFFIERQDFINNILIRNDNDSTLVANFKSYIRNYVQEAACKNFTEVNANIPLELLSDYHSNTILLILEWIFIKQHQTTIEQAHTYLRYFINRH